MATLVIKNCPNEIHDKLKELAHASKSSMSRLATELLTRSIQRIHTRELPTPVHGTFLITDEWLEKAIAEGRE